MNTKELIEKQIERVADQLDDAKRWIAAGNDPAAPMIAATFFLLQIVQNLLNEIEALEKRVSDLEPQTAMGLLNEIVRRGQAGEFYKGGKKS